MKSSSFDAVSDREQRSPWMLSEPSLEEFPKLPFVSVCFNSPTSTALSIVGRIKVERLARFESEPLDIMPWIVVRLCLARNDLRVRCNVFDGSISSAEIQAPGLTLASGWRKDVVYSANASGKPVS